MRQVVLQVPEGRGAEAARTLADRGATTLSRAPGTNGDGDPIELLVATIPNAALGPALEQLEELGRIEASVPATGVYAFEPPAGQAPAELVDVTPRSALEVVLAGRQAIGGWNGFLTYAFTAGVVVWIGLYEETPFLLTASMLLAPFAGPAMNTAIGMVSGDSRLLRRGLLRYGAGILVTAAVSALLTVLIGQVHVTGMAAESVTLSNVAFLLPVVAGVAGATWLVQSEHSSLVSGAAVGVLVAAALAPSTGAVGMAGALGRWDLVGRGSLLLLLQLAGITLAAAVTLRAYGVTPSGYRYASGRHRLLRGGIGVAATVLGGLLVLQFLTGPQLQRASVARQAAQLAGTVVEDAPGARLLEVSADVPSARTPGPPRVVVRIDAELDAASGTEAVADELTTRVRDRLREQLGDVVPLVDVTVLDPG